MELREEPVFSLTNTHGHKILVADYVGAGAEYSLVCEDGKIAYESGRQACFAGARDIISGNKKITHVRVHLNRLFKPVFSKYTKIEDREIVLKTYFSLGQEHGAFPVSQSIEDVIKNGYVDVPTRETSEQRVYLMLCYVRHVYEDFPLMENLVNLCVNHEIPFWLAYPYCCKINSIGSGHSVFPFYPSYPRSRVDFSVPVTTSSFFGAAMFFNTDMEETKGKFGYEKNSAWQSQPLYQNFLTKKPKSFPLDRYIGKGVLSYCMEKLEETSSPVEEASLGVPTGG